MNRIIAVDLDGTLISSDTLVESFFLFLRKSPFRIFLSLLWLIKGKAYLKNRLAEITIPDQESLPYNKELLLWLSQQREAGAKIILATAANRKIATAIADHLAIFDEVIASQDVNLSGSQKQNVLVKKFGEGNFEYVGNSKDDLPVWKSSAVIHLVNPEFGVLKAAKKLGVQGITIHSRQTYFLNVLKALRLHQWVKNALIFVPLLASHLIFEAPLVLQGLLAFLAFGLCASSVYLLNDLVDLPEDRRHSTKCKRPLAAGSLPLHHCLVLIPLLLGCAFSLSLFLLPYQFSVVLFGYYILTLAYSLWLKRMVMLDTVSLSILYTSRVIAGAAAMSLAVTFWILAFCTFIFLSLAFVKRYSELFEARLNGNNEIAAGRGYYAADYELLASLGGAAGYISVLVLALYINDPNSAVVYHTPEWLWFSLPLLLFWLSRVWLLAHRGEMHDDPIVFALRDGVSRWVGVIFLAIFVLATI